MQSWILLFVLVSLPQGLRTAQWTSAMQEGGELFACEGSSLTLPWQCALSTGDVIMDIQWRYDGSSGSEMIAFLAHGNFVPLPAFSGNRVRTVGNAGIVLSDLTVADSGNYSVEVNGFDESGTRFLLNQTVIVHIGDNLMTQDGELHVQQMQEAVLNQANDQWSIQLTCGHFTALHTAPFSVEWITPNGLSLSSTDFNNGDFHLLLPNPVRGGNYTCRVPPQHLADACLHDDDGQSQQQGEATVFVDKVDARLTLLEKENEQLKDATATLIRENQQANNASEARYGQLQRENELLRSENRQLQNRTDAILSEQQSQSEDLRQRVEQIENAVDRQVNFHATGMSSYHPPYDTPLIITNVLTNQGRAYNGTTGYFTAPYAGTYFFIATSGTYFGSNTYVQFDLFVDDDQKVDEVRAYASGDRNDAFSTVHGVVHLRAGQKVWVRSHGEEYYGQYTTFSGFILSADF